jgi:hypothetical protein
MATTTNYSWSTPDDTALVKDGAAAIRTLGSSVDTTTKALNPSTTLGDIEYRSSTANTNTRLAIGTTNQVLTVTAGVPTWANPQGGYSNYQVFTSSGTWTVPTGVTKCAYYVVGGGSGGGSGQIRVTSATGSAGGGGGGGNISYDPFYTVTPADVLTVTIGAGGAGAANVTSVSTVTNGLLGAAGSSSTFDLITASGAPVAGGYNSGSLGGSTLNRSIIQKTGGRGGDSGNSAAINTPKILFNQTGTAGSNGSAATDGTTLGTAGTSTEIGFAGGGGGGQEVTNSTTLGTVGNGGTGGGAGGAGATSATNVTTTAGAGGNATVNTGAGGGGGGAAEKVGTTTTSVTSGAGGNGGSGIVVLFY